MRPFMNGVWAVRKARWLNGWPAFFPVLEKQTDECTIRESEIYPGLFTMLKQRYTTQRFSHPRVFTTIRVRVAGV
jgi:hypothetical protein